MIGFYLEDEKCNVLPELSLYDKTHDLYEIIHNIPYSQATCCFCLSNFFNNINLKTECTNLNKFVLNTDGLNMDWFKSRIIVLKCNHIFHLCCFAKYVKHKYTEYIFSNIDINNINDNNEIYPSISRSLSDRSNKSKSGKSNSKSEYSKSEYSKSEYSILKNDSALDEIISNMGEYLHKNIDNTNSTVDSIESYNKISSNKNLSEESYKHALSNIRIYYEYLNNLTNDLIDESNKSEVRSFYESGSVDIDTNICFKIDCPLCKKKVNNIDISSILEKYKILLELYA